MDLDCVSSNVSDLSMRIVDKEEESREGLHESNLGSGIGGECSEDRVDTLDPLKSRFIDLLICAIASRVSPIVQVGIQAIPDKGNEIRIGNVARFARLLYVANDLFNHRR